MEEYIRKKQKKDRIKKYFIGTFICILIVVLVALTYVLYYGIETPTQIINKQYDATKTDYDVAIIDIDTMESLVQLNIHSIEKKFFVTSFDVYSLKRGLEVFENLKEPIKLTKVLFSKNLLEEENEYLDYLASQYKIEWDDYIIAFPLTDESVIIESHSVSKIRLKRLSEQYKLSLEYIVQYILDDVPAREISKARANAEREG